MICPKARYSANFVLIAVDSLILERTIGISIEKKRCLYNGFILA
uniref:Uncharacterized protein n=1 Tax=Arundo donax TaxID=35708 RepID=A0A0A9D9Z2_ARUDO